MKQSFCLSDRNIDRIGEEECDHIVEHILKQITESDDRLKHWKEKITKWYDLYGMVQRKKNYEGLATIFVPEILRAVETVTAKIYGMIVGEPQWFEYSGRDGSADDDGPAIALTRLVSYQMDENHFKSRLMDSIRQLVLTGLCVRKIGWDYQEVTRKIRLADGSLTDKDETIKDTWTYEPVDLLSIGISDVDVPYNDIQKARWISEQTIGDKEFAYQKMSKGWFSSRYRDKFEEESEPNSSASLDFKDRKLQASGYTSIQKRKNQVEYIEVWGLLKAEWVMSEEERAIKELDADDMVEGVVVIGNRKAILKLEVNPYGHGQKPYVFCPYIPKEGEFAGMGVAQVGETLQEEINDTRNQTMDNKTLILMTMWVKTRASGIKNQDLRIRPNGVITTNDINGLAPLRPPVVSGVGTNMEGVAKNDLRESVGAASNLQGIAQAGVDTATESTLINKESVGRINMVAQLFSELILKPTLLMAEYLNYQFYDHEKVISVIGPIGVKFIKISPNDIAGSKNISIKLAVDATESPSVMRQQLMNLLSMVQQMPPQVLQFHWNLIDKIYGNFFNGHKLNELYPSLDNNPDDLLSPEEERDCVIAKKSVVAKQGQDHKAAMDYLTKEFQSMRWSLDQVQFSLFEKLIASHHNMLMAEVAQQKAQYAAQMMAIQNGDKGSGPQPVIPGMGTAPGTTPYTQEGSAPTGASIRRGIGG